MLRFSPEPKSSFRAHKLGSRPNRTPQRHPLSNHFNFGSRPNRSPMAVYCITTSVLARSEHPMLYAGVSGVPLQAGLEGNSLHDFPIYAADITQNRCMSPARAVVFTPTSDILSMRLWALSLQAHKYMKSSWYHEYDNTHVFHWSLLTIKRTLDQYRLVLLFIFDNLINRLTITFPTWTRKHKHVFSLSKHQPDCQTPHATVRCATNKTKSCMCLRRFGLRIFGTPLDQCCWNVHVYLIWFVDL